MKYYIIAGEASGDLHGSSLMRQLNRLDSEARFRCWGGDLMQQEGGELVKHYRDLAFMGFVEVLLNLRAILQNIKSCKNDIAGFQPDVVILIDYPGFNIRIAKWAKKAGFKVVYYISPQIWAWKENRVHVLKRYVDRMLVILPFEQDFYARFDYPVHYVGHPLVEVVAKFKAENANLPPPIQPLIALLPGSRKQEIAKKLPVMLEASRAFPNYQFVVAMAPGLSSQFYEQYLKPYPNVSAKGGKTYAVLNHAAAALVTSGTATLETALFRVPEVVCYKGNYFSYLIAKAVIKVKYISLVNLIMNKQVVTELIQDEMNTRNCVAELDKLLHNTETRQQLQQDYATLSDLLSQGGKASSNAANVIFNFLK